MSEAPAGGAGKLTVAFATDAAMEMPLAVALLSLYDHHAPEALDVYVVTDVDADARARITRALPANAHITFRSPAHPLPPDVRRPPHIMAAAYWRLLLGSLVPEVSRVLYLDSDVMCRAPLTPLWETDLAGHLLAAVSDATMPWLGSPCRTYGAPRWQQLGLSPRTPYFNAGVLLIDLARWRAQGTGERALELARRHLVPYGDQDVLLGACDGVWLRLDPRWNMLPEHFDDTRSYAWVSEDPDALRQAIAAPAVVHFTSSLRPWRYSFLARHPLAGEWFALLDRTPWKGWRPRPNLWDSFKNAVFRLVEPGS